jgi:hypothetical protein
MNPNILFFSSLLLYACLIFKMYKYEFFLNIIKGTIGKNLLRWPMQLLQPKTELFVAKFIKILNNFS